MRGRVQVALLKSRPPGRKDGFTSPSRDKRSRVARVGDEHLFEGAVTSTSSSDTNVGAIVGGVLGGLVSIVMLALDILFIIRRRRKSRVRLEDNPHRY